MKAYPQRELIMDWKASLNDSPEAFANASYNESVGKPLLRHRPRRGAFCRPYVPAAGQKWYNGFWHQRFRFEAVKRGEYMTVLRRLMSRFFHRRSMQYQLFITYLGINLLPLLIVGALSYQIASLAIVQEARRNNDLLLEAINRNINFYIREIEDKSTIFSSVLLQNNTLMDKYDNSRDIFSPENLLKIRRYVTSTVASGDEYVSIRVYSDNGRLIDKALHKNTYTHAYSSPAELAWQQRMKENTSDELIFDLHQLDINGIYSFTASRAIMDPNTNRRIGYISYDKTLSSFSSMFKQIEYRSGGVTQVIKKDGTLLYHSNNALIGKKADRSLLERFNRISADTFIEQIKGQDVVVTFNRAAGGSLYVVGSVPLSALTEAIKDLRNMTIIVSCLSMLLVLILSYFLSIYMIKPIKKLNSLMSRVERGNFNVRRENMVNVSKEINQLNNSFHTMVDTINHLIKIQYETELHKKDAELKALLMQINPHFLYNTLEVINGIADYEGVTQISEITQSLSKMLRYNIDLNREHVQLSAELEHCRHFFLILKSRFEDQLIVDWDVDPEVGSYMIVKMVLQPLLENSIKHGVEKKLGKGFIKLSAKKYEKRIEIEITDNGVGFDTDKLKDFEQYKRQSSNTYADFTSARHLGLKNVYTRLRIVFGDEVTFHINSIQGEGTTITINIPAVKRIDDGGELDDGTK